MTYNLRASPVSKGFADTVSDWSLKGLVELIDLFFFFFLNRLLNKASAALAGVSGVSESVSKIDIWEPHDRVSVGRS